MKIIVIGTGFVGLTHAAVLSEYGHEVHGYDIDARKIATFQGGEHEAVERYVNEPGLVDIMQETLGKYLFFTTDLASVIEGADVIFLCPPPRRRSAMARRTLASTRTPPARWRDCSPSEPTASAWWS